MSGMRHNSSSQVVAGEVVEPGWTVSALKAEQTHFILFWRLDVCIWELWGKECSQLLYIFLPVKAPPFTPLSGRSYSDGRHMTWISSSNLSFLAKRSWQCTEKTAMCGLSVTWQGAFIVSFLSPDRGRLYFCFVLFFLLRNDVSNGSIIRGSQLQKFVIFPRYLFIKSCYYFKEQESYFPQSEETEIWA